jgi:F-box interacting protein
MVIMPTSYLSEDLLRDILLRLPVKPLVRFRSVSKSWSALLKSRDFTTTHLSRSANHGCHLLVNSEGAENHTMSLISSEALDVAAKIENPEKGKVRLIMVGSCNGLVCLYQNYWLIRLWNPATREHKILPTPRITPTFPSTSSPRFSIGFGCHLNDYKLVRIVYSKHPDERQVEVYSTSIGCWRSIDAIVPCFIEQRMCSVILKGVPYWLGFGPFWEDTRFGQGEPRRDEFVVSFDMGKEVFRQVHVPYAEGSYSDYSKKLGVLNESLAIIYYPCREQVSNFIDFWVMTKDHGVDECWIKAQRIGPFSSIGIPLGFWKDGVVVCENGDDELLLYDPNIKAVKKLSTYGADHGKLISTNVSTYMESLVPVNG